MDPNIWTSLKSSQSSGRTGVAAGPELALSLQPSLTQPTINSAVNLEIWALLDRQQRIAAASGLAAGFLPQSAILTPSYGTNASFGSQYAATNSLYHYNTLPVGQPVLTGSYEGSNILASQQQGITKNTNLATVSQYKVPLSVQQLCTPNCSSSSTVTQSTKTSSLTRAKKSVACSFVNDQPSRPSDDVEKRYDDGGLRSRLEGTRMMSPSNVSSMSCSLNQSDYVSNDLSFGHILDSVTNSQSTSAHATTPQSTSHQTVRPNDTNRLVLASSEFGLDQLSANSCLDLSQFSKPDSAAKSYLTEQNFQAHEFSMLNADGLISFGHPCEIMSAVNMSSNKETSALNTTHSQQSKQHSMANRVSPLPWSTAAQFCEQQGSSIVSTSLTSSTNVQPVAYEAVSPPPSSETQSFSFVDSLHLYPDGVQVKDLLSSAYELADNQVYVKNLPDMPLIYAAQSSGSDGSLQISSGLTHSLSLQPVAPSGGNNSDKSRQSDMFAARSVTGDRENAADRCRRQKSKLTTEVGVVLPMLQSKSTKQLSSNPLITQYELPTTLDTHIQQQQQPCAYETIHFSGESAPHPISQLSLNNYKLDMQQKLTSPDLGDHMKHAGFGSGVNSVNNCSEVSTDTHNSPIVLTNITGNVYVNQYTMLQPGSMPLINQDLSYQSVARYEQLIKGEQEKTEQKTCSVLLVPNENDDEFGHLSIDPVKQNSNKPCIVSASLTSPSIPVSQVSLTCHNILPKRKVFNSAFENSYLNFVQGHKSETLSSVTNSPIKNRPVLPKYIPEVRRPRTETDKTSKETNDSSGSQKQVLNCISGTSSGDPSKVVNSDVVVSYHSTSDCNTVISSFSSTSTTKFPAKFSHKLLGRAQILSDNSKTDNAAVAGKEKCEVTAEFKWKKMSNSSETSDATKNNLPSPKLTKSLQASDHGTKRRLSSSADPPDVANLKTQQVQWTVSKKSKYMPLEKTESADIPILVIKAVSTNPDDDKRQPSSNLKLSQDKSQNSNSVIKKSVK